MPAPAAATYSIALASDIVVSTPVILSEAAEAEGSRKAFYSYPRTICRTRGRSRAGILRWTLRMTQKAKVGTEKA
jgi:hypothetical protein